MTIRWSDFTMLSGLPIAVIGFFPGCRNHPRGLKPVSARTGGQGKDDRRHRTDVFACVRQLSRLPCGCAENRGIAIPGPSRGQCTMS